jgi:hypothetical protein
MTRIKVVARGEISEANKQDKTSKSFKIPGKAMERMYLTDCGSKPPLRFSTCARCVHSLLADHHSTRVMHGQIRWWLRNGKTINIQSQQNQTQYAVGK